MSKLILRKASLLDATEEYIAHQCNCVSIRATGLAGAIFKKHPKTDDYAVRLGSTDRNKRRIPIDDMGTIKVHAIPASAKVPYGGVINMMSQHYPGPVQPHYRGKDMKSDRREAFEKCLGAIAEKKPQSVAFPYRIGCGLAGGEWIVYEAMLEAWATRHPDITVVLYRPPVPKERTASRKKKRARDSKKDSSQEKPKKRARRLPAIGQHLPAIGQDFSAGSHSAGGPVVVVNAPGSRIIGGLVGQLF